VNGDSAKDNSVKDIWNGVPMWVKAIALVGFPVVVALYFMGQSAGVVPSIQQSTHEVLVQHVELTKVRQAQAEKVIDRFTVGIRVLCENAARTDGERNNCRNIQ